MNGALDGDAEVARGRGVHGRGEVGDLARGERRHQPTDRQRHLGEHATVEHRDLTAAELGEPGDGDGHVGRSGRSARADDHAVVRVVRDRRRDRTAGQPEPRDPAEPDPTGRVVAFEHGDPRDVERGIGDVEHEVARS